MGIWNSKLLSKRSWKYWLLSCVRSREYPCTERMEISIVEGLFLTTYSLPGVKGCRSVKFFFDTDSAVSARQLALFNRDLYLDCKTFEVKVLKNTTDQSDINQNAQVHTSYSTPAKHSYPASPALSVVIFKIPRGSTTIGCLVSGSRNETKKNGT